mgnify:CR=1 FL=1|tara:strand:- start:3372 stop:3617 length:246 start_codon:yes stop_codon:yes gene_type:complete
MNIIDKTLKLVEDYNSTGQEINRHFVEKGIRYLKKGDTETANFLIMSSGLKKEGILFFAIRMYLGSYEEETKILKYIIDNF